MSRTLLAVAVICLGWQTPAFADDVVIDYTWKGQVNKRMINGTGKLTIAKDGKLNAEADFTQIPETFSPSVLDNSFVCFQCIVGHEGSIGLQTLLTKKGDQVFSYRSFVIENDVGEVVGAVTVSGTLEKVGDNKYVTQAEVNGQYSGPVTDIAVDGYTLKLSPARKGRLMGTYEASFAAKGKKYKIYATTEYTYAGLKGLEVEERAAKPLSFDIKFEKSVFDGKQLKFSGIRVLE